MKKFILPVVLFSSVTVFSQQLPYKNAKLSAAERAKDLLLRMTRKKNSGNFLWCRVKSTQAMKTNTRMGSLVCRSVLNQKVAEKPVRLASVARPVMELKGFQRIHLKAGETKEVSFTITTEMLTMLDKDLKPIVEPGDFRIMIGSSSRDIRLKATLIVKE